MKAPICRWVVMLCTTGALSAEIVVTETEHQIRIRTSVLEAAINKHGYVSGIAAGSFLDHATGFRDPTFGLDIVDWIMEPGSDEEYRSQLPGDLPYHFNNEFHGKTPKRSIEGPQICTQAKRLHPRVIRGRDFVAVQMEYKYHLAAPGKRAGSTWQQTLIFTDQARYVVASDRIKSVNSSDAMFLRIDMPGHIKHNRGDTFSEVYLSYYGQIPAEAFFKNFAPDEQFNYRRDSNPVPSRFIRAYRLRDPKTGADGPWLAGLTLDPDTVYEAWCHQRGYVCFIEEIGGRPIDAGESFGAAYVVGYFDTVGEMETVYDKFKGNNRIEADENGWQLLP